MTTRDYGQYCGLARALDVVGERWALLLVRDLLVGPRRYTDLRRGLPKIPTNVLAARLKELEAAGVVQRRILPRPAGSVVYELTAHGAALERSVVELGRWGAQSLGDPRPDEVVTADSVTMALRTTFRADAAAEDTHYELRMGEITLNARVHDGALDVGEGPAPQPDLVIEAGPGIRALMARELTPDAALATGTIAVTGDPALLARFQHTFRI